MSKNAVLKSFSWLSVLTIGSYFVPLIVTPYLARSLGVNGFGLLSFVYAIVTVFQICTDWGYTLTAPQRVALALSEGNDVALVARRILWTKIFIATFLFCCVALSAVVFESMSELLWTICVGFVGVFGVAMTLGWFFQGIQQLGRFTVFTLIGRVSVIPLVLVFVDSPEDVVWAVLCQGGGAFVAGVLSLAYAKSMGYTLLRCVDFGSVFRELRAEIHHFLAAAISNWGPLFNTIWVGQVGGASGVALYAGADRLRTVSSSFISQLSLAFLPVIAKATALGGASANRLIVNNVILSGAFSAVVSTVFIVFGREIIAIYLGPGFEAAADLLRILAFGLVVSSVGQVIGLQVYLPRGGGGLRTKIITVAWILNVPLVVGLAHLYGVYGVASSIVITECFLVIGYGFYFHRFWKKL